MPNPTPPRAVPVTATLHIGARETVVLIRQAGQPVSTITLAIGAQAVPATLFRHDPPTAGEIENAIMVVEDEVMPALARMPAGAVAASPDPAIRQIAVLAGVGDVGAEPGAPGASGAPPLVLGLDALERVFDRFSAIVQGRPPSQDRLPSGPAFAATLLILREVMHHLKFATLTIEDGVGEDG